MKFRGLRSGVINSLEARLRASPVMEAGHRVIVIGGRRLKEGTRLTLVRRLGLGQLLCRTDDGELIKINQREVRNERMPPGE